MKAKGKRFVPPVSGGRSDATDDNVAVDDMPGDYVGGENKIVTDFSSEVFSDMDAFVSEAMPEPACVNDTTVLSEQPSMVVDGEAVDLRQAIIIQTVLENPYLTQVTSKG